MNAIKTNNAPVPRSTAELAVPRAMKLLRTLGTDSMILAAMKQTGFDIDDMKQGWSLVLKACSAPIAETKFTADGGPVAEATQKIEAWQSTMFLRTHAALRRLHPAQDAFIFENLESGTGVAAVVAVSMFLERLDALETSADRKSSRKGDHAAVATLEKRGVTKEERKEVRALVELVETTPAPAVVDIASPDARMAALVELHAWVQDWSDCARSVITRRDQLLRLGIGRRRARAIAAPGPQPTPVPQPQPLPPPVLAPPPPVPPQLTAPSLLAASAKSNGLSNGAVVVADGGTHA